MISGLYRIQEINKAFEEKQYRCTVRMRRLVDVANSHEELRALDKQEEQENRERLILLDLSKESHYHEILKQVNYYWIQLYFECYYLTIYYQLSLISTLCISIIIIGNIFFRNTYNINSMYEKQHHTQIEVKCYLVIVIRD